MFSLFKKNTNVSATLLAKKNSTSTATHSVKSSLTLVAGSEGEHKLQEKYGSRQRALKFYDKQMLNHLSPVMQAFIPKQEVMFVATADAHGDCDCSARFGKPGFVRVINKDFLMYPEYRGNGVLASQGNILENPHIGIIFIDFFETTVGLHVNGIARIIEAEHLLQSSPELPADILSEMQLQGHKKPDRWIMIEVEEAYIHCSKHVPLLKKLDKDIDWGTDNMAAKGGDFFQLEQLSCYERLGGDAAIKKTVNVLYKKIILDPKINPIFEPLDISTQIDLLKAFLSLAFADEKFHFNKDELGQAHKHLIDNDFNDKTFDCLIGHLHSSAKELEIPEHEIASIMSQTESIRAKVLCR